MEGVWFLISICDREETGVIPSVGLKSSSGGEKGPLGRLVRFAFWLSPPLQIEAPQGTDPCLSGSPSLRKPSSQAWHVVGTQKMCFDEMN